MPLKPDHLASGSATDEVLNLDVAMASVPESSCLWIALSGGLDSVCLLRLAADSLKRRQALQLPVPVLKALHVNHHLQTAADAFEQTCINLCDELVIPLCVDHVSLETNGEGVEAAARDARYQCFADHLDDGDIIWMAHHKNDQAETFLLRLLRGAGLMGLSAMPMERPLGRGKLQRPLLKVSRQALEHLAEHHHWAWIEDPSNQSHDYARNQLRHEVVPALESGWPTAVSTIVEAADHLRESHALLHDYALEELKTLTDDPARLPMNALAVRTPERSALLIRCALAQLNFSMPPRTRLHTLLQQLEASADKSVEVTWGEVVVRSWRGYLYVMSKDSLAADTNESASTRGLRLLNQHKPNVLAHDTPSQLTFSFRQGGERLYQNGMHRKVKTLLQASDIPPWERDRVVLVFDESMPGKGESGRSGVGNTRLIAVLDERYSWFDDEWWNHHYKAD